MTSCLPWTQSLSACSRKAFQLPAICLLGSAWTASLKAANTLCLHLETELFHFSWKDNNTLQTQQCVSSTFIYSWWRFPQRSRVRQNDKRYFKAYLQPSMPYQTLTWWIPFQSFFFFFMEMIFIFLALWLFNVHIIFFYGTPFLLDHLVPEYKIDVV